MYKSEVQSIGLEDRHFTPPVNDPHYCDTCRRQFKNRLSLREHLQHCRINKFYNSAITGTQNQTVDSQETSLNDVNNNAAIEQHEVVVRSCGLKEPNNIDEKNLHSNGGVNGQMEGHFVYRCPEKGCGREFSHRIFFVNHKRYSCKLMTRGPTQFQRRYSHPCPENDCGKLFAFEMDLKCHMQNCEFRPKPSVMIIQDRYNVVIYVCPYKDCDKTFPTKKKAEKHLNNLCPFRLNKKSELKNIKTVDSNPTRWPRRAAFIQAKTRLKKEKMTNKEWKKLFQDFCRNTKTARTKLRPKKTRKPATTQIPNGRSKARNRKDKNSKAFNNQRDMLNYCGIRKRYNQEPAVKKKTVPKQSNDGLHDEMLSRINKLETRLEALSDVASQSKSLPPSSAPKNHSQCTVPYNIDLHAEHLCYSGTFSEDEYLLPDDTPNDYETKHSSMISVKEDHPC